MDFSGISLYISPDFLGVCSRYFSGYISGISQGISWGMSRGIIWGISRGVSRVLDQRGSRCNEDQDATRIKMRRGCTGADAPGQMHRGSINGSDMPSALGLVPHIFVNLKSVSESSCVI